ncbi:MAG: hypothetical protein ACTSWC_04275, partial [Promethearchaeota archaeon]
FLHTNLLLDIFHKVFITLKIRIYMLGRPRKPQTKIFREKNEKSSNLSFDLKIHQILLVRKFFAISNFF